MSLRKAALKDQTEVSDLVFIPVLFHPGHNVVSYGNTLTPPIPGSWVLIMVRVPEDMLADTC